MKRTLLLALALAVIPVGVDAQAPDLEETRARAEQGNVVAQYNLGLMYSAGDGVPENDAEAARWYRLAADQGHARSQYNLGTMYYTGSGLPEDNAEAVRWWRLAADQGYASAQYNFGLMYATGEGIPTDDVLAYMWWNLAAGQGHEGAQRNKDTLEDRMTREQIAEAQRLSREWIEAHPPGGN